MSLRKQARRTQRVLEKALFGPERRASKQVLNVQRQDTAAATAVAEFCHEFPCVVCANVYVIKTSVSRERLCELNYQFRICEACFADASRIYQFREK